MKSIDVLNDNYDKEDVKDILKAYDILNRLNDEIDLSYVIAILQYGSILFNYEEYDE